MKKLMIFEKSPSKDDYLLQGCLELIHTVASSN